MKKLFLTILIFPLIFNSCSKDKSSKIDPHKGKKIEKAKPIVLSSEFTNKLNSNNTFAFDLFKSTISNSDNGENIFISPLSVNMALSMVWNGADGETFDEMRRVLRNSDYNIDQINQYSKDLREALVNVDPNTKLTIANSIWANKNSFILKDQFVADNKKYYDAEVKNLDFSNSRTLYEINEWCASKTNNLIPKAIEEINQDALAYLINAIYFKGIWCVKFDVKNTADLPFNNYDGSSSKVKMMQQTSDYLYGQDDNWRYLDVPYGNTAFSMAIMIPQNNKNIKDLLSDLDDATWKQRFSNMSLCEVNVKLPRFKAEYSYSMDNKILPDMGMRLAFSPQANFSKMGNRSAMISRVVHKTFVEVNEEGTEAASITVVEMIDTALPGDKIKVDFFVDKPFVYVIKENSTGAILFMGMINKM